MTNVYLQQTQPVLHTPVDLHTLKKKPASHDETAQALIFIKNNKRIYFNSVREHVCVCVYERLRVHTCACKRD